MRRLVRRTLAFAAAAVLSTALPAAADTWNERTILEFSEAVMVPGATLPPGTYVFRLLESDANRHVVQIQDEDRSKVFATTQAVPIKRDDPKGDVVLKFDPTEPGTPPAMRAWFYPGSTYGHEFVYPEEQAREIARRTKTVVLSVDVPGTDLEKGTLRAYQPTGDPVEYHADAATQREWNQWRQAHASAAPGTADVDREERQASTAPAVDTAFEGMRVTVDELEDDPARYIGQQVSVDAEVEDVLGPRLFTIDEPRWGDLEGEVMVYVPTAVATLVREDDRVTVSGTPKAFVKADIEGEWGWLGIEPDVERRLARRPILVADRIVGGDSDVAVLIDADAAENHASGTGTAPLTDVASLAGGEDDLVGRRVRLDGVIVAARATGQGFFVEAGDDRLFVLPSKTSASRVESGQELRLEGIVLQMPDDMAERLDAPDGANEDVYVLATRVDRASGATPSS